ncbi:hypothetical protein [Glaciecola sp. KUL10]|uniref:hypothetical protein n=1 Tax=Glaciecola sp. (strain KUL10) TaxID=2161813 RepID=UPI000D78491D|nr:hypothetical protein [Glaciecola sp. KUL10]GBL02961.1 hypothetical protein KUL10_02340 [Glaciecola sp. KUL10]
MSYIDKKKLIERVKSFIHISREIEKLELKQGNMASLRYQEGVTRGLKNALKLIELDDLLIHNPESI